MNDVERFNISMVGSLVVIATGGPLWSWVYCIGAVLFFNYCMGKS